MQESCDRFPNRVSAEVRPAKGGDGPSMMQGGRGFAFRLAGMSGPFYLGINGLPDDWAVSQITVDGVDVTDEPMDLKGQTSSARVVLTDRVTTLSGTVQARRNSSNYSVVVFPDDMNRWSYPSRYVKTARANERGQFRISGLPPNERSPPSRSIFWKKARNRIRSSSSACDRRP